MPTAFFYGHLALFFLLLVLLFTPTCFITIRRDISPMTTKVETSLILQYFNLVPFLYPFSIKLLSFSMVWSLIPQPFIFFGHCSSFFSPILSLFYLTFSISLFHYFILHLFWLELFVFIRIPKYISLVFHYLICFSFIDFFVLSSVLHYLSYQYLSPICRTSIIFFLYASSFIQIFIHFLFF
jgi:hypothetical protein